MKQRTRTTSGSNRLSALELLQISSNYNTPSRPINTPVIEKTKAFVAKHLGELLVITAFVLGKL